MGIVPAFSVSLKAFIFALNEKLITLPAELSKISIAHLRKFIRILPTKSLFGYYLLLHRRRPWR